MSSSEVLGVRFKALQRRAKCKCAWLFADAETQGPLRKERSGSFGGVFAQREFQISNFFGTVERAW